LLSSIRTTQSRISAIEQRLGAMAPASSSFDAALTAEMESDPVGTGSTSDWAVGGTQAMSASADPATLASWLGTLTANAGGATTATTGLTDVLATASGAVGGIGDIAMTGGLTPANLRTPGDYARLEAPPELAGFGNGQIPSEALAPIGVGSHRLWAPAATAFQQMSAAAAADGVTIGVTDSYRSYDSQVDLARRKGLYSQGGLAATPGTSNHGWGLALDLDLDGQAQSWMQEHAWQYGFVESVPREPWHYEYRPAGHGS
jgi:zinc D-Ala-D-Ala carboxypeptidase